MIYRKRTTEVESQLLAVDLLIQVLSSTGNWITCYERIYFVLSPCSLGSSTGSALWSAAGSTGFHTSFVACMTSKSWPICSADICGAKLDEAGALLTIEH